ncbi:MAG: hypothetical protein WCL32_13090 [Planctomycetota bacterium]|jgi:hypothetical protein
MTTVRPSMMKRIVKIAFTLSFFLLPAFLGFGNKFREFLMLVGDEDGAFALMPVMNYLLASVGFFFLLCWATMHGMFRDIEKPKETLMANERFLDEEIMINPLDRARHAKGEQP